MKNYSLAFLALAIGGGMLLTIVPCSAHEHAHGPPPKGTQGLDVYSDGSTLHLLTAQYGEAAETAQLLYQRSLDGGANWSAPVRVDTGLPAAKNPRRGGDPQIVGAGDKLAAVWMSAGSGFMQSGPMAVALSSNGGKTWRAGPNPADDNSTGGHAYVEAAADTGGAFHIVWLDSRDGKQALRYARSSDGGDHWSKNATLDPETCECCWNTLLTGSGNRVWTLYRDKNPRDMALAVSDNGGESWQRTGRVGSFNWQFPNCPESGGGLAICKPATGPETLHALVRTGKEGSEGVHYQNSPVGGKYWSPPRRLAPGVADHPDLAGDSSGNLVAAWDGLEGDDLVIKACTSKDNGTTWTPARRLSAPGTNASHPRTVATAAGLRVFWTYAPAGGGLSAWASAVPGSVR